MTHVGHWTRGGARLLVALIALLAVSLAAPVAAAPGTIALAPVGSYRTGLGSGSGETVAYLPGLLYVTNSSSNTLDVVDLTDPASPALVRRVDLSLYGAGPNSVAASNGLVAVAVEAAPKTDPGKVVFFDRFGTFRAGFTVGALPDMVTFTPDGRALLVANEGEPSDDYTIDPPGSVSIIDLSQPARLAQASVTTAGFAAFEPGGSRRAAFDPRTRIYGPTKSVAQNLEPEYITVADDLKTAYVTLQENNAIGTLDLTTRQFTRITALGYKDHSLPGNGLDASDRDNAINIANWPVRGLYQPDAIASFTLFDQTYLVTANEGDARGYTGYNEEIRVGNSRYKLDPAAFPNAADLKQNSKIGRLNVTIADGDSDGDGDYDAIYAFGARSFSIWTPDGQQVFDSGDQLEQITAAAFPANFNANNDSNSFDDRSDNKGPEPEGAAVGIVGGRTYAFIGLERIGGVMVYDVTNPRQPEFVQYANTRNFGAPALVNGQANPAAGDLGPEIVKFIPAALSPTGVPLLLLANEVSGSVTVYAVGQ